MRIFLGLASCAALFGFVGCRTTSDVLRDYEANVTVGNYAAAVPEVAELAAKNDDSRLLWHLLAASGSYLADDKANAIAQFNAAEDAMQRNDRASVFSQAGQGTLAMMTNDRAFPYDGGGQDRIFACLYKAIDFLSLGQEAGARTELNRASQYQDNWIYDRRREIEAASARLQKDADAYVQQQHTQPMGDRAQQTATVMADASFAAQVQQNCGFNLATSGNLDALAAGDYVNTYAQHVTGVFRWLRNDGGEACLKSAASLSGNPAAVRDAAECAQGMRPKNQVWIWVEDGLCPSREEWRVDLPLMLLPFVRHYLPYVGMALPVLRERTWGASSWAVQCSGGERVALTDLANVDKLVKTEYDVYMRGAISREITRTIVKAGVQVALGVTSENVSDRNTQLALKLSQIGVAAWAASSTAADLRSWTTLPKTVKCIRVDRPADGKIDIWADGQQILLNMAEGNSFVFIRKPGPQAMPVVKQVTFK